MNITKRNILAVAVAVVACFASAKGAYVCYLVKTTAGACWSDDDSKCSGTPPCYAGAMVTTKYPDELNCWDGGDITEKCNKSKADKPIYTYNNVCNEASVSSLVPEWVQTCVTKIINSTGEYGEECSLVLKYTTKIVKTCQKTPNQSPASTAGTFNVEDDSLDNSVPCNPCNFWR